MDEVDERVLQFIEALKAVGSIGSDSEFADSLDMQRQNVSKVRRKESHFTIKQIYMMQKVYNGNPNWFFGIENNMFLVLKPAR